MRYSLRHGEVGSYPGLTVPAIGGISASPFAEHYNGSKETSCLDFQHTEEFI